MAAWTNYFENKVADHLFRGIAYSESSPASFYVALFTAAPSDTGGGTEVSGGSYARVAIARTTSAWKGTHGTASGPSSGTSGTISNDASADFPAPTADWGQATHFGFYDASTGGNLLVYAALTTPKTINNGDAAPSFPIDALTHQVDD